MASSMNYSYPGTELDLFAGAINWKSYWSSKIEDFIKGEVLEVGAGMGNNTRLFMLKDFTRWVCLEPDFELAEKLRTSFSNEKRSKNIFIIHGKISALNKNEQFDTIIYIDVLEHIKDDKGELSEASEHLKPGGNIIVLSPALNYLYSEFDRAIGHLRRYSKQTIKNIVPVNLKLESLFYLDSIGVLVSCVNKVFLKQSIPIKRQIKFWDNIIIPGSKLIDRLVHYRFGKSIIAILNKPE